MYFFKPKQKFTIHDVVIKEPGFTIYLHEDFLIGHPLFNEIKKYSFFDYEINEVLHSFTAGKRNYVVAVS
jgi:AraC family transcriptional activator of pobA